jgi:EAL domain-containing protein (putative c-di-GMP-specific phosphodiesterase class I)
MTEEAPPTPIKTIPPPAQEPQAERLPGTRVLLADDDRGVARSLRRVLVGENYDVTMVADGAEAAEALMKEPFDVVLSDIHMPNMSGVELLSLVRAYDLDVPVILLTGDPSLETAIEALKLGAIEYLTKPWENEALLAAVKRAVKLHALARTKREAMKLLGAHPGAGDFAGMSVALDRTLESLYIAFQPIVDLRRQRVLGYECFMRSMERALPTPHAILEAAEKLDRLAELGRKLRRMPVEITATHKLPNDALLFVNIHEAELLDDDLYRKDAPLSLIAPRVVLELTERATLARIPDVRRRIADLRRIGFLFAVDDLGGGYAGLSNLAILEPDFVKFDMSIIRDIHTSTVREKLVGSMAQTCRELGMSVIVEGVEKAEDRDRLAQLGCELMQGHLFAKPGLPYPAPHW